MGVNAAMLNGALLTAEVAELGFANANLVMSVRTFVVHEGLDRLFEVLVTAGSREPALDLDGVVGHAATFRILGADDGGALRFWSGLCREVEQLGVQEDGLAIYLLRIVPELWRLTQRTTRRSFQHVTAMDIATTMLAEWGLTAELRLQGAELPRHEYRVQLDESDYAFLCRQLEEAGVSYWFEAGPKRPAGDRRLEPMQLVLGVEPQRAAPKHAELPLRSLAEHSDAGPYVRDVRVSRSVRPGRYSLRGHEFRASPELVLLAEAHAHHELERHYELKRFQPKEFLTEALEGGSRVDVLDERAGVVAAQLGLDRARTGRVTVRFATNVLDLFPGVVVSITGHPRADLCHPDALLVVGAQWEGDVDREWKLTLEALPTRDPYRAPMVTPKPRAHGLESALVIGPPSDDEEIHTDAYGRVKVRFHWSKEGAADESASAWLRVSQGWAGNGYGMVNVPRVGTEVLIGFFEGDPDQPLVVGRAFNRIATLPYPLPQNRTKSVWRSSSSPGGEGFNELSFEDRAGEEVVHVRAQRDLELVTLNDERSSVGADRHTSVRRNDRQVVGGDRSEEVHGSHHVRVGGRYSEVFEGGSESRSGARSGITMEDGKLIISNGQASIVLDGPIVRIDAAANIWLRSDRLVTISSKTVTIDKNVSINQHDLVPADVAQLAPPLRQEGLAPAATSTPRPVVVPRRPAGVQPFDSHAFYEELLAKGGIKVKLPKHLPLPDSINEQLEHFAKVAHGAQVVGGKLLQPERYTAIKERVADRLEAEKERLVGMSDGLRNTFEKNRAHLGELSDKVGARYELEQANLGKLRGDVGDVFAGKSGGFVDSVKALVGIFKEQAAHVTALRRDVCALIEQEQRWLAETIGESKAFAAEVMGYLDGMKDLVEHPKDALLELALGSDKAFGEELGTLTSELGGGDEVAKFFGNGAPEASGDVAGGSQLLGLSAAKPTNPALLHATTAPSVASLLGSGAKGGGHGGLVVARGGGLAAQDVAAVVRPGQLGFLQSPSEGQLMVIPTETAVPLSESVTKAEFVEAQLAGHSQNSAMNNVLRANGYAVYERPWGDWSGPFVQAATEAKA